MDNTLKNLIDTCYEEMKKGNSLITACVVIKDCKTGETIVYSNDVYGCICKW